MRTRVDVRSANLRAAVVLCAALAAAMTSAGPAAAQASRTASAKIWRYAFKPGLQIDWSGRSEGARGKARWTEVEATRIWVVRRGADGDWRLLRRTTATRTASGPPTGDVEPPNVEWERADVRDDGFIAADVRLKERCGLAAYFPSLPADAAERARGWRSGVVGFDWTDYAVAADAATFTAARRRFSDPIEAATRSKTCVFDAARGLVRKLDARGDAAYASYSETTSISLEKVEARPAAEAERLEARIGAALDAVERHTRLMADAARSPAKAEDLMSDALGVLVDAKAKAGDPEAEKVLTEALAGHDDFAAYVRGAAGRCAAAVGNPAPSWEASDMAGVARTSLGLRGRAAVMLFVYRGSNDSLAALPYVKAAAERFKGRAVGFLAVTCDKSAVDAKAVAEKAALGFPVIHGRELATTFGVGAMPTTVVLDPAGVVRYWIEGPRAGYGEDVEHAVEALLAARPGGPESRPESR